MSTQIDMFGPRRVVRRAAAGALLAGAVALGVSAGTALAAPGGPAPGMDAPADAAFPTADGLSLAGASAASLIADGAAPDWSIGGPPPA